MKKLFIALFIFFTLPPLYGKDTHRISIDGAFGKGSSYLIAGVGISLDFIKEQDLNYRFSLQLEGGDDFSGMGNHDYEGPDAGEYQTVMLYGGIAKNGFYKYGGYQLSLNLGVGGVNHERSYDYNSYNYDDRESINLNIGMYAETRGYLGPLFLFLRGGVSSMGSKVMIGIGISSF